MIEFFVAFCKFLFLVCEIFVFVFRVAFCW